LTNTTFDADPYLLNLQNGVLKFGRDKVELLDHRPEFMLTKNANVMFDGEATCPIWHGFLQSTFEGDHELIRYLQQVFGICLTGDVTTHAFWMLFGEGRNGKGVLLNTLARLLGDYACFIRSDTLVVANQTSSEKRDDILSMEGARLIVSHEIDESQRLDENLLKQLTGGDEIKARGLYKRGHSFSPTAKLFFSTNHHPRIYSVGRSIWSRLKVVPFNVSFAGIEDTRLMEKLKTEYPGILNWAISGYLDWRENGLLEPECVTATVDEYREDSDTLAIFMGECLHRNDGDQVKLSDLLWKYNDWRRDNGCKVISRATLKDSLKTKGFKVEKHKHLKQDVLNGYSLTATSYEMKWLN
jgi:putative DNA primase/helicase